MPLTVSAGDAVWVLVSAALVVLMTPALGFFYAGQVRANNASSTILHCVGCLGIVTVVWVVIGHTFAFGPDIGRAIGHGGWIGGLDFLGLRRVNGYSGAAALFEMVIAVFAVSVVSGAYVERMKIGSYVAFAALWVLLVYAPIAHWFWGGGLLGPRGLGAIDFGGGAVVHQSAGIAALAVAVTLGPRRDRRAASRDPSFVLIGVSLLWVGWFGFVAGHGTVRTAGMSAVNAQVAAAAGMCGWLLLESFQTGKQTATGAAKGALAGLIAISPAAGSVRPLAAMLIGAVAAVLCQFAAGLPERFGYDDPLGVFALFWVGGAVGMLFTGVFASGVGLVYTQQFTQVGKQALASGAASVWSFALSFAVLKVIDLAIGLRVAADEEDKGLDVSQHGEVAYGEANS